MLEMTCSACHGFQNTLLLVKQNRRHEKDYNPKHLSLQISTIDQIPSLSSHYHCFRRHCKFVLLCEGKTFFRECHRLLAPFTRWNVWHCDGLGASLLDSLLSTMNWATQWKSSAIHQLTHGVFLIDIILCRALVSKSTDLASPTTPFISMKKSLNLHLNDVIRTFSLETSCWAKYQVILGNYDNDRMVASDWSNQTEAQCPSELYKCRHSPREPCKFLFDLNGGRSPPSCPFLAVVACKQAIVLNIHKF